MSPALSTAREISLSISFWSLPRSSGEPVRGGAEIKLQLSEASMLFQRLNCADFIKNDDRREVIELQPERRLSFEPISASYEGASLRIEHLHWHDVRLYHGLAALPQDKIADWFEYWFDVDDGRYENGSKVSNVIHSLSVESDSLSIDFGTAAPEAFWKLLEVLKEAGASAVRVTASTAE